MENLQQFGSITYDEVHEYLKLNMITDFTARYSIDIVPIIKADKKEKYIIYIDDNKKETTKHLDNFEFFINDKLVYSW